MILWDTFEICLGCAGVLLMVMGAYTLGIAVGEERRNEFH